jgi:hypothetical protein
MQARGAALVATLRAGMDGGVATRSNPWQRMRDEFVDLGPLRAVAVATAVLPTAGTITLLARLPALASEWPAGLTGVAWAAAAIGAFVACVALPGAFAAFAAGACLGAPAGAVAAFVGLPLASWLGQRVVWPVVVAPLYPFMRARPRVAAVRALCAPGAVRGALALRLGCSVPFQVVSLYLSAAAIPARATVVATALAAALAATPAACLGAAWRRWQERGVMPSGADALVVALAAAVAIAARLRARAAVAGMP